uniref:C3H1-type domain-containing protein n=1 Tax=Alexandrium monilatum TaxID=311494 RepID=A0A7S4Q6V1_9DINO|mmetsp:Transcript_76945/g.239789  ORF Transcript_76945/g.239789 Transcript_76945/m.239789 type:complete len:297 (-) Transcript_76945:120-1010(-)
MLSLFTDFAPTCRPLEKPSGWRAAEGDLDQAGLGDGVAEAVVATGPAAARSRSTSVGSSSPRSSSGSADAAGCLPVLVHAATYCSSAAPVRLPEFDCPSPFVVDTWRPPLLDDLHGQREVGSIGGSSLFADEVEPSIRHLPPAVAPPPPPESFQAAQCAVGMPTGPPPSTAVVMPPPPPLPPVFMDVSCGPVHMMLPPPSQAPCLQLAQSGLGLELGSPGFPTIGSQGHHFGTCKPCAFVHTKGCGNGTQCLFCHLCLPGEKKRRQRERFNIQQRARDAGVPAAALGGSRPTPSHC